MGAIVIERTRAALDHLSQAAKGLSAVFQYPERLMTMTQLRAFLALAEAGGFSAAAHSSGMSQTAVHRAVSDLEHMIGGQLVERRGRAVWLNPAGRRLARGARLAVAEIIAAVADLGFDSGGELIAFGALPLARPIWCPPPWRAWCKAIRAPVSRCWKAAGASWSNRCAMARST
jgi:molybdenum-dependent DNA-binding transcriptional regulator ModE